MAHASFIHLRVFTSYSLSEGANKLDQLVEKCHDFSMPALAMTDRHNLFAALEFSEICSKNGIQPIIGCTLRILEDDHFFDLPVYVQNKEGYQHLLHLISLSYLDSDPKLLPHLTLDDFNDRHEGIIALSGASHGLLNQALLQNNTKLAEQRLERLKTLFPLNFYLELTRLGTADETITEPWLLEKAYQLNLPIIATNPAFFPKKEMSEAHDALLCIASGSYVAEENRRRMSSESYLKSEKEMCELFKDLPEAIQNTLHLARRCSIKAEPHSPLLPAFSIPGGKTPAEQLRHIAREGLKRRLEESVISEVTPEEEKKELLILYEARLEEELEIIIAMNYPGYFLIVADFIQWAKRHHIPVGPGRGSGAGSLVAWVLEITELDPIRFGLVFERFLNPERVSMPDFDIDFCQERRDEVIYYVQEKYGADKVAQIITFGKLQARAVLRDVGRVLQLPYGQVDKICKMVPNNPASPVTLAQAIDIEPSLQEAREDDPHVAKMIDIALQLEGLNRHASVHAAGVVIADRPIDSFVPLYRDPRSEMPVVQYSMKFAEMAGLVKFDFLGLKTLSVIAQCCEIIKKEIGSDVNMNQIPLDDAETYKMLSRGESIGVFQFESKGMRDSLRKMRPDTFEDLIALGALYRPGPMDNIPTYVARKHGEEKPDYLHPTLKPILEETFGVIIYQEQVMQIARVLAGYTLGKADLLRRAMGKKIKSEMDAQRAMFVEGAIAKGVKEDQAVYIFDLVAKFAGYGFNKSHAAAYAMISYQTAYLKAHYKVPFLVATLNFDLLDTDKIAVFCQEAKDLGVTILPPDVNDADAYFTVTHLEDGSQAIRYGLGALKHVGVPAMEALVQVRKEGGSFKDIVDFLSRLDAKIINKRQMEYLIKAGAFDTLEPNRRKLLEALEALIHYHQLITREKGSQQISLFGQIGQLDIDRPKLPDIMDWEFEKKVGYECEAFGFYLFHHPLDVYEPYMANIGVVPSSDLDETLMDGTSIVRLIGVVHETRIRFSSKGRFAYVELSDLSARYDMAIFQEALLEKSRPFLYANALLYIKAEARKDEGGVRLVAQTIDLLATVMARRISHCRICCSESEIQQVGQTLQAYLKEEPSGTAIVQIIMSQDDDKEIEITLPGKYVISPSLVYTLRHHFGLNVEETIQTKAMPVIL